MWTMPWTKEITEDLRLRIVDLHKAGKCYKSISKNLDVHQSTVRQIVYKWRKFTVPTLPRSGRPAKMTARAQHGMLNELKKNPRVSAKDLQKSLEHANISVDESIRKTLNKNGVHGRTPRKKPLLSKKTLLYIGNLQSAPGCSTALLAKYSVDRWNYSWVVWREHTTLCLEKKWHSTNIKTSSQL